MRSPKTIKEVWKLTSKLATHNQFIFKATDWHLPSFKILIIAKKFKWTKKCEDTFIKPNEYISTPPLLSNLSLEKSCICTFVVSITTISLMLLREDEVLNYLFIILATLWFLPKPNSLSLTHIIQEAESLL